MRSERESECHAIRMGSAVEFLKQPDNIAVIGMFAAVIFFTCLALSEARKNDRLTKQGKSDEIPERMRK
jgi:hypothetical protein